MPSIGTVMTAPLANSAGRSQPALGLFEDPVYTTTEIPIQPGDFLMLFTDGIFEVLGQHEEIYSQERLLHDVKRFGLADAFDRRDRTRADRRHRRHARAHRFAVEVHSARAALGHAAAELRPREVQDVAQRP